MSDTEKKTNGQKPRTSKLAIVALLFGILSLCTLAMEEPHIWGGKYIEKLFMLRLSAICGLILGIVAFIKVKRSYGMLCGQRFAILGIVTAGISVTLGVFGLAPRKTPPGMVCGTNLRGLGKAMLFYAKDYDGQYPASDKWCDLLIMYLEVHPKNFICTGSDVKMGESSYAFNENLIGKKLFEIPVDVVVMFETNAGKNLSGRGALLGNREWFKFLSQDRDRWGYKWIKKYKPSDKVYKNRWNQVGGPEILTTENHNGKGCFILFNDGHVEFVKTEHLDKLKWKAEDSEKIKMKSEKP